MEILKVENLNKIYGKGENEVKAVNNISFSELRLAKIWNKSVNTNI